MSEKEFSSREESLKREVIDAKKYCDFIVDTSEKTPEEVFEEVMNILGR
jgi:chloramphenicol 3-O-phosphotransferase